jgi:hypothetical protein
MHGMNGRQAIYQRGRNSIKTLNSRSRFDALNMDRTGNR